MTRKRSLHTLDCVRVDIAVLLIIFSSRVCIDNFGRKLYNLIDSNSAES